MPATSTDPRERLITLLAQYSARRGQFTLASGKQSTLYIDARLTTMHPEGLTIIGPLALAALRATTWGRGVTAVGGLTLGADPISYAISYASALAATAAVGSPKVGDEHPVRAFTVRKEIKQHGTGKLIEGPFVRGDRVAIIEDVITTGASALRAVEAVRAAGGLVCGVLALVDREEGGRQAIESQGRGTEHRWMPPGGGAGAGAEGKRDELPVLVLVGAAEIVARIGRA
jgi:orotate phosphoribosyltransferase